MKTLLLSLALRCCLVGLLLLSCLTFAACKRRRPEPQPEAAQSSPMLKPGDTSPARAVEELNYALQDYRERTGTMPKTLSELLTASKLAHPALPPGGRLELDQRLKTVKYVGPSGK